MKTHGTHNRLIFMARLSLLCFTSLARTACAVTPGAQPAGTADTNCAAGPGVTGSYVHALLVEPDDKVVIGGNFTTVDGVKRNHLARLLPDGHIDTTFDPGKGPSGEVLSVARQADGKILVGGVFNAVNGVPAPRLARLNRDGSVDESFKPGSGPSAEVRSIVPLPDGRILLAGWFTSFNKVNRRGVAMVQADGTLDPSFDPGAGPAGGFVFLALPQADGKILVAGEFMTFNGAVRGSIARCNADGSLDTSFQPGKGVDGWIGRILPLPDGKVLIAGDFNKFQSTPRLRIARLQSDGSLDATFDPGSGITGSNPVNLVHTMLQQADGQIIIAGMFDRYNGTSRPNIARLTAEGRLDMDFNPKASKPLRTMGMTSNGQLVVGGEFSAIGGATRNKVAWLYTGIEYNAPDGFSQLYRDRSGLFFTFRAPGPQPCCVEYSNDFAHWEKLADIAGAQSVRLGDLAAASIESRFYRAIPHE